MSVVGVRKKYFPGLLRFFGETVNLDQNWGRGEMNFNQNGWGATFFNFVWGGEQYKGQCFEKNVLCGRIYYNFAVI